jgi:phosphomannomutase
MSNIKAEIVREYDIRGVYNKNLFNDTAYYIGKALAKKAKSNNKHIINVGYDARFSSLDLVKEIIAGINDAGCDVNNIGLVTTPMLYFSTFHLDVAYGVMVTASHNPKEYNGFKFISKIEDFYGSKLREFSKLVDLETKSSVDKRGEVNEISVEDDYLELLLKELDDVDLSKINIAWDPASAAACNIVKRLSKTIKAKNHYTINTDIDPEFKAHDPDPTIEKNLKQLKDLVIDNNCDLGIAFDGDADRIGVVDSVGEVLWGDQLLTLFAKELLSTNKGESVIADVKSSNVFQRKVRELGGNPIIWKTGHSLIKVKMRESGAKLAGEMSGHVFFKDRYFGYDDGVYAAIRLIRIIAKYKIKLSDYRISLGKNYSTKEEKISSSEDTKFASVRKLVDLLKKDNIEFLDIDGVRVEDEKGWWLVRASNTSPYLVTRCEGITEEDLEDKKNILASYISKII